MNNPFIQLALIATSCCLIVLVDSCNIFEPDDNKRVLPDSISPGTGIGYAAYPDWSPTGERLAFVRDSLICLYYFSDKHIDTLTTGTEPNFSPDGTKLAFERDKKIYWIDIATKQEFYLSEGITPNWSANGKWIAFANKTASRLLTDAKIVNGQPSPDGALFYFDLDSNKTNSVIISNHDSLWIGLKLSFFSPVWAMHDSILFFSAEYGIWKVKRNGGRAIFYPGKFPTGVEKSAPKTLTEGGFSGQQRWNETTRRLVLWESPNNGEGSSPLIVIVNFNTGFEDGGLIGKVSDPCWSPDGLQIAYYERGSVQFFSSPVH